MIVILMTFFLLMIFKNKNNLLSCLLMMEGFMLMILYFLMLSVSESMNSYNGLMLFMYIVVAEGCLGLSLLVIVVRSAGKDKFYFHNFI